MTKELFIVRGVPGCGKSTFAESLCRQHGVHLEADMYFMKDGKYKFNLDKLRNAHEWCYRECERALQHEIARVVVSNTSTQLKEFKKYMELGEKYGYTIYSIVVENRHGGTNSHNVPEETLRKMKDRFEIKL